jgi:signal transduction histidine kinase
MRTIPEPRLPTSFLPAERAAPEEVMRQHKLFAALPHFNAVFDSIPDPAVVLNETRQAVFANKRLLEFLDVGRIEDALGGRPGELVECVRVLENPGGCGTTEFCVTCGAARAIADGLGGKKNVRDCIILRETGAPPLELEVYSTPFELEGERFTFTALKDASSANRRRQLERIFFHDVLNLVAGLQGYADALREEVPNHLADRVVEIAHKISEEIEAQKTLLAAENNELPVNPEPVESVAILSEVAFMYRRLEAARDVGVVVDQNAESVRFSADPTLLRRVVGNLLKNAIEASGPLQTVTLGSRAVEWGVELTVHNRRAMSPAVQAQVFQRSFSTKGDDRGLGTHSARLLVERYLRGKIRFVSDERRGTTFFVTLPLETHALDAKSSDRPTDQ